MSRPPKWWANKVRLPNPVHIELRCQQPQQVPPESSRPWRATWQDYVPVSLFFERSFSR